MPSPSGSSSIRSRSWPHSSSRSRGGSTARHRPSRPSPGCSGRRRSAPWRRQLEVADDALGEPRGRGARARSTARHTLSIGWSNRRSKRSVHGAVRLQQRGQGSHRAASVARPRRTRASRSLGSSSSEAAESRVEAYLRAGRGTRGSPPSASVARAGSSGTVVNRAGCPSRVGSSSKRRRSPSHIQLEPRRRIPHVDVARRVSARRSRTSRRRPARTSARCRRPIAARRRCRTGNQAPGAPTR